MDVQTFNQSDWRNFVVQPDINEVIHNILSPDTQLVDDDIQGILNLVARFHPEYEMHPVSLFRHIEIYNSTNFEKCHLQIIGSGISDYQHWICIYYDKSFHFYDRLGKVKFQQLNHLVKSYIMKRYISHLKRINIIDHQVTT